MAKGSSIKTMDTPQKQSSLISLSSQQCPILGRSAEESILLNSYFASLSSISASSDVPAAVVQICGESGQGKTKLAESIRKTVLEDDGYFIRGKFDQNISCYGSSSAAAANLPYSAIASAFGEYCSQLERRGVDDWEEVAYALKEEIREDEGRQLCEAIPALSKLLTCGENERTIFVRQISDVEEDGGEERGTSSQNRLHRLNFALKKFVSVIAKVGDPIVFLVDDMQWADASSLDILRTLVLGAKNPFTFIFTYRPVDENHPLLKVFNDFSSSEMRITEIMLQSLRKKQVHKLISIILGRDNSRDAEDDDDFITLSNFIFHATNGNPFFVRQQIIALCDNGLLWHTGTTWSWKTEKIKSSNFGRDIVSTMLEKMKKLPQYMQSVLVICACLGSSIDISILRILAADMSLNQTSEERSNASLTDKAISIACEEVLLVRTHDDKRVNFFHDSIQSAAYSLLEENKRPYYHLNIASVLKRNLSPDSSQDHLFMIASQLARGYKLITSEEERIDSARIFLQAGTVSKAATAFSDAFFFFSRGILVLLNEDWVQYYQLCCDLHMSGAEVASFTGNYDDMEDWLGVIFEKSKESVDVIFRAYYIQVRALWTRDKIEAAVDRGIHALRLVGENFPTTNENVRARTLFELVKTRQLLRGKDLHKIPQITDKSVIPVLRLLDVLCTMAAVVRQKLLPLFCLRIVQLNLQYGLSSSMPTAMSIYSFVLGRIGCSPRETSKYANIALSLQDHIWKHSPSQPETMANVHVLTYGATLSFTTRLSSCREPLLDGYRAGVETGDVFHALICSNFCSWFSFHSGQQLRNVLPSLQKFGQAMAEYKAKPVLLINSIYRQAVLNFLGFEGSSCCLAYLKGSVFDYDEVFKEFPWAKKHLMLFNHAKLMQMMTAFYFCHYEVAWNMSEQLDDFGPGFQGFIFQYICAFYRGMTAMAMLQVSNTKQHRSTAMKCLKMLRKGQKKSPINLSHQLFILEAEHAAHSRKHKRAEKYFVLAVEHAQNLGVIHEWALAHERFGHYHFSQSNHELAYEQIRKAHKLYSQWGSLPKCELLSSKYPHLTEEPRDPKNFQKRKSKRFSFSTKIANLRSDSFATTN